MSEEEKQVAVPTFRIRGGWIGRSTFDWQTEAPLVPRDFDVSFKVGSIFVELKGSTGEVESSD